MLIVNRIRRLRPADEQGQALVLVVFLILILGLLSPLMLDAMSNTAGQANDASTQAKAHAAAEAGINDYIAKLLNDTQYYSQYVAPGEATRKDSTTGNTVASVQAPATPSSWTYGTNWSYPNGKDAWVDLGNGFSYDLEITAPQTGSNATNYVLITATGKSNAPNASSQDHQVIQELVRPASVADFQMFSKGSVCYGDGATTNGKIYTQGNLYFTGTYYADINAEGSIYLSPTGAHGGDPCSTSGESNTGSAAGTPSPQKYDSTNIRTAPELSTKPDFSSFQVSLVNIQRAARYAKGLYLTSSTAGSNAPASAWRSGSRTTGWFTTSPAARRATPSSRRHRPATEHPRTRATSRVRVARSPPAPGPGAVPVPTNGAIYSDQTVIIYVAGDSTTNSSNTTCKSGGNTVNTTTGTNVSLTNASCLKGRVSIASNADIVIADDQGYVKPGTDVLGLLANNNTYISGWLPANANINYSAASLSENGSWGQPSGESNGEYSNMYQEGSIAQLQMGNGMEMFDNRYYNYDPNLQFLQPPWFPTLPNPYQVLVYRNLPNASS